MTYVIAYLTSLVLFTVGDLIWLGVVAKGFYRRQLGALMADPVNLWAAAAFYLIYSFGLVVFAVAPVLHSGAWMDAAARGALLGLVAYAAYDLTNLATLRNWPLPLTLVDMLWGTTLSALVAASTVWLARSL
jgi:uncharacterized membrane protein